MCDKFSKVFQASPAPMSITRLSDWKIVEINQAFIKLSGFSRQELIGQRALEMEIYRDHRDREHIIQTTLEKGGITNYNFRFKAKGNKPLFCRISTEVIELEELCMLSTITDLTEIKRVEEALRESEAKFKGIYESSHDAIMLLKEDTFIDCNRRSLEMFGIASRQRFLELGPADVSPPSQPDGQDSFKAARTQIERALHQGYSHFEWMHRRNTGENFAAEVSLVSFYIGKKKVIQASMRDISELKRVEAELRAFNEELEQRVNQRTIELEQANRELLAHSKKLTESTRRLELRIKNAIGTGDTSPSLVGLTPSNLGNLKECLNQLKQAISWDGGKKRDMGNGKIRAKGISCFWKTPSTPTDAISGALLIFNPDGSINLNIGPAELGVGSNTVLAQILAERLKWDINKIHVTMEVDTELNPVHWKTVASMTIYMAGRAVLEAAEDAINQLKNIGSIVLRCSPTDLDVAHGRIFLKADPNQHLDVTEVAGGYKYQNGNAIGGQIMGRGTFIMKHLTTLDHDSGKGIPGPGWTLGAQAVEVEFDTRYCTYNILKAVTVIDAGKVLNPKTAEGVVKGGMHMGLSFATREYFAYDMQGKVLNHNLRTYKIMRFGENPQYVVNFLETPQIDAPYGARGFGEHGDIGMPAALGNSLSAASDTDLNRLPLFPETIWKTRKEAAK